MNRRSFFMTILLVLAVAVAPEAVSGEGAPPGLTGGGVENGGATFISEADADWAGRSVAGAGDVNGDGYDDLLLGAPYHGGYTGRAYLFLGGPGGWRLDQGLASADAIYTGQNAYDQAGWSVASAGDVNGDGYDDLLVGARGYSDYTGRAYLVLGSSSPYSGTLSGASAFLTGENTGDYASERVAGAGDVDGDGLDDLLVGADQWGTDQGRAYLLLGSSSPYSGTLSNADAIYTGESSNSHAGASVAGAGDVNGDGYGDILVGAWAWNSGQGRAYLVLGGDSPTGTFGLGSADAIYGGENTGDYAGYSVAGAGDANGDGYSDILVGAYLSGGTGRAYLVLGESSPWSGSLAGADAIYSGQTNYQAGRSVAGAGDVNGDGYGDLLIGASRYSSFTGRAYLVLGASSPSGTHALDSGDVIYTGENTWDYAGESLAGAGDVNGDGTSDLLIGAYGFDSFAGKAYLVFSDYETATAARYRAIQTDWHAPVEVGSSGLTVDFESGAPAGSVYVTRHFLNTCGTSFVTNGLLWTVDSQRGGSAAATLAFRYNDTQVAGWTEGDLKLYYRDRPCQEWTEDTGATLEDGVNRITSSEVTDAHREYTISPGTPSPTALGPTSAGVTLAQEPTWMVGGLALLVLLTATAEWWRRSRRRAAS